MTSFDLSYGPSPIPSPSLYKEAKLTKHIIHTLLELAQGNSEREESEKSYMITTIATPEQRHVARQWSVTRASSSISSPVRGRMHCWEWAGGWPERPPSAGRLLLCAASPRSGWSLKGKKMLVKFFVNWLGTHYGDWATTPPYAPAMLGEFLQVQAVVHPWGYIFVWSAGIRFHRQPVECLGFLATH